MPSAKYRLFHRLSHSNALNFKPTLFRLLSSQKQRITTSNTNYKSQSIVNNAPLTTHSLYSFNTKTKTFKNDDEEYEEDTDSDFSDFTDSDDSDVEEPQNITKKAKTSNWEFNHSDITSDLLMKDRLIVSNLNFSTNRNDLWELCENYGTVIDVHLPSNKNRDFHNRGFGFVTFESDKDAQNALDNIAGIMFNSRQLRAGYARKDTDRSSSASKQQAIKDTKSDNKSDFKFTVNPQKSEEETMNKMSKENERAISINGLPGNVNLAQITRMFGEFGDIVNISLSPYRMFGFSFMNAVVSIKMKDESVANKEDIKDRSVDKNEMKTMRTNVDRNESKKIDAVDTDVLAKEIDELLADSDEDDDDDDDDDNDDDDSESDDDSDLSSDEDEDDTK